MRIADLQSAIALASARWTGWQPDHQSRAEAYGRCPWCGGTDRFVVFADGGYWCRATGNGCGRKGWLDEKEQMTEEERRQRELEWRVASLERKQREQEERLTLLERMHQCTDHVAYHRNLDVVPGAREYWLGEGLLQDWQDYFQVGYCGKCPSDQGHRPSYTIPIFDRGELVNIRHRLIGAEKDKYRPHMAGLGACLFGSDLLDQQQLGIVIVEGEKKAMVCQQYGIPAVGIAGQRTWRPEWDERFAYLDQVYIALDPDATASAYYLARAKFPGRARIVTLPAKPDDFFARFGGTPEQFQGYLRAGRKA